MKLIDCDAVLAWPGWEVPLGLRARASPISGTWDDWETLASAWTEMRRSGWDNGGAVGGLAGWFGYDGSFTFLPCLEAEWLTAEELFCEAPGSLAGAADGWECPVDEVRFEAMVAEAQEWIRRGHIYQVNLARELKRRRITKSTELPEIFRSLWRLTHAPCAGMVVTPGRALIGASPEIFLEIHGNRIVTKPIKGTRPRRADPVQDQQMAFELSTHPKEIAELVMITDLMRHDLGQVCEFGSVQVTELIRREALSHVFHAYSKVEGELRSDLSVLAAVRACFPGGSVTGAPKKRACELIKDIEPVDRGLYTGAYGLLGADGSVRLAMTIRSLVVEPEWVRFHVGSGITAESDARAEFEETCHKARALWQAWELFRWRQNFRAPSKSKA